RRAALALYEIAQLNGLPETAFAGLEKCLEDPDNDIRKTAARVLALVKPANAKAAEIDQSRKDGDTSGKHLAAELGRTSPHNKAPLLLQTEILVDKDARSLLEAYRVLAKFALPADPNAPGSVQTATTLLKAMRQPAVRSANVDKNSFFMRDVL